MRKRVSSTPKWRLLLGLLSFNSSRIDSNLKPLLERMDLVKPESMEDKVAQMLLVEALTD